MRVGQTRKRDTGENAIVAVLRKIGVIVKKISAEGIPDLLCYHPFTGLFLLEVKAAKGRLTPAQVIVEREMPFLVARTEDEALSLFWAAVKKYKQ